MISLINLCYSIYSFGKVISIDVKDAVYFAEFKGDFMKYLYQLFIILLITFIGEVLYKLIPLPIPASIYGLLIMLFCLKTKIVKLEKVRNVGDILLEVMPLLFIPAAVGLLTAWEELADILLPIIIITLITTIIVMVVTGRVTQFIMRKGQK